MSRHGWGEGAWIYVADSAMVTQENLEDLGQLQFISRLPATYGACAEAIEQAVDARRWKALGTMVETKTGKSRPPAVYASCARRGQQAYGEAHLLHDEHPFIETTAVPVGIRA